MTEIFLPGLRERLSRRCVVPGWRRLIFLGAHARQLAASRLHHDAEQLVLALEMPVEGLDRYPGRRGDLIDRSLRVACIQKCSQGCVDDDGAFARHQAGRPLIEDNSVTSKPTTLVDLRVGYKISEQARLWLDVLNLFNNTGAHQIDYFYPAQLANETAPVYDVHFKPVEPLSARLTLSMTF